MKSEMKFIFLLSLTISLILISCNNEKLMDSNGQKTPAMERDNKIDLEKTIDIKEELTEPIEYEGWREFTTNNYYHLDIRYATKNNFVGEQMYECGRCYLREEAAAALIKVAESLKQIDHKLVLFDCYRPKPVQQRLWDKVPNASYVTPPSKGSMHNRGVAIDLSIMDKNGDYLNMGTEYDFFGREAHTDNYDLPKEVLKNRTLLQKLMESYGFKGIRTEWWHFSYASGSYEIADWEWDCTQKLN